MPRRKNYYGARLEDDQVSAGTQSGPAFEHEQHLHAVNQNAARWGLNNVSPDCDRESHASEQGIICHLKRTKLRLLLST